MKKVAFKDLAQLHEIISARKLRDTVSPLNIARVECRNSTGFPELDVMLSDGIERRVGTHWAMSQFCSGVIEIPYRIFESKFETVDARNYVLSHRIPRALDRAFLIREQNIPENKFVNLQPVGGWGIRGFLSGEQYKTSHGYQIIDHPEPVQFLMDSDIEIGRRMEAYLDYDELRLRIVNDEPVVIRGQELDIGIEMLNGETGKSGCNFRFYIERVICTNGMIISPLELKLKIKHAGKRETVRARFYAVLERAVEFLTQVPALIESAMKTRVKRPKTIEEQIEAIAKKMRIGRKEVESIQHEYDDNPLPPREGEESLWDLSQAFTSYANTQDTTKQLEIQDLTGQLLLFPTAFNLATIH